MFELISACRSCGNKNLIEVLSLGIMPLANAFIRSDELGEIEAKYPLELVFCPRCSLIQLSGTVSPKKLFQNYLYFSSFSDTMLHHAKEIVHRLIISQNLNKKSLVIELGSNDGYLLQYFQNEGIPVLGIEPAQNVAEVAEGKGIKTICEFFGRELAYELYKKDKRADVIIANNVLAHVADLNGFVEGIGILLKEDGIGVIEVPYVKNLIEQCEFDTIYHEHLCYYSLTALSRLFQQHNMIIEDVERINIHGGSLRIYIRHNNAQIEMNETVYKCLEEEETIGMTHLSYYSTFKEKIENIKLSLKSILDSIKKKSKKIAGYGAAAKGTVFLNFCGIGRDVLEFVVDRSPYKQGYYMPGVHIPIFSPDQLFKKMPDYTLLLTWNFADEILEQQKKYREQGGKFIIPIPKVRII